MHCYKHPVDKRKTRKLSIARRRREKIGFLAVLNGESNVNLFLFSPPQADFFLNRSFVISGKVKICNFWKKMSGMKKQFPEMSKCVISGKLPRMKKQFPENCNFWKWCFWGPKNSNLVLRKIC